MLKKGIFIFFFTFALWLLIDTLVNSHFNELVNIEITYYSECDPINFSLYYSSSELFEKDLFLRKKSKLISENKYIVTFDLKPFNINNIRIDTEFEKFNSEVIINEVNLISKKNSLKLKGDEISQFVDESNDIKYELLNSGIKITPAVSVENADYFIILTPLEKISYYYFGGISKKFFLNFILISILIVIVFKLIKYVESFYWHLITSLFFTAIFFNKPLLIASIISLTIVCIVYIIENGRRSFYKKNYFIISFILVLYAVYMIISFDLSLLKLLEYQFTLILFPLIFYFLNFSKSDLLKINLIIENISILILVIILTTITIILIESNLSLVDVFKNSPNLKKSIFIWLDHPLHPSFLSYTVFIGLLFMISNIYSGYYDNHSQIYLVIWVLLYFFLMIIIGSRVSLIFSCILFIFIIVSKYKSEIFNFPKAHLVIIILLIGILIHILLYSFILENVDFTRYHLWKLSLQLIWENPWMGIEYNHFEDYYKEYLTNNNLNSGKLYGHPHNQFLYVGLNFGLPILLLFGAVLSLALYKSIQSKNSLLFFFLIGSLTFMTFDLLLNSLKGVVPFAFFFSLITYTKNEKYFN